MTQKQLLAKIEDAIMNQSNTIESTKGSDNPQTVGVCNRARGSLLALDAVRKALKGNSVDLNILIG